mmetsp:Transcript_19219/g.18461  ORF Transcript_19219/g.18461 Transcript_19219/m.18461 type:complete len:234 (+) Transcript_19219:496-1197(+)
MSVFSCIWSFKYIGTDAIPMTRCFHFSSTPMGRAICIWWCLIAKSISGRKFILKVSSLNRCRFGVIDCSHTYTWVFLADHLQKNIRDNSALIPVIVEDGCETNSPFYRPYERCKRNVRRNMTRTIRTCIGYSNDFGALFRLNIISITFFTMVRSARIRLSTEGRTTKKGIFHIKVGRVTTKIRMESIVTLRDIEGVPFTRINSACLSHYTVTVDIDFPHRECRVHQDINLWQA